MCNKPYVNLQIKIQNPIMNSPKKIFTEQATTALWYAKALAHSQNMRTISGDELFW